jgi:hypothetical protein
MAKFSYEIERHDSLPSHIANRSNVWRELREALNDTHSGEWLRVSVPDEITEAKARERFVENVRSGGVYAYYSAMGGKKHPFVYPCRIERDENRVVIALWVGKEPAPKQAINNSKNVTTTVTY